MYGLFCLFEVQCNKRAELSHARNKVIIIVCSVIYETLERQYYRIPYFIRNFIYNLEILLSIFRYIYVLNGINYVNFGKTVELPNLKLTNSQFLDDSHKVVKRLRLFRWELGDYKIFQRNSIIASIYKLSIRESLINKSVINFWAINAFEQI